ncbi:dTDP-4-dehydrorhamnose reductase [Jatrophihabitans sp.]|uniref:dTDP-4-dehydrorhamnose reductase n=1 Tax=Jatrophihabitans sp. TaxID=1932789 RepID=UPI002BAD752E|nr:dTDP-4-dehydrorhamnose reductase [Jatrophihabitans sp.]
MISPDARWLVTGARGQLGTDLCAVLAGAGVGSDRLLALGADQLDITSSAAVQAVFADFGPQLVVNAAAYTAVDQAEAEEERAYAVNATGPALLAAAAARTGARLLQVSTDYVFAGDADQPYPEQAQPAPRSAYGRTKLAGELAVRELAPEHGYVVRTAWVYGATGTNFVKTMARLERDREFLEVVDDQRGSPTWSADLARGLVQLAGSDAAPGTYHCTGAGETSWWGLARAVFEELGADPERVRPTSTGKFPRPAPRPAYSVLSDAAWRAAGLRPLPHWRAALRQAFAEDRAAYLPD